MQKVSRDLKVGDVLQITWCGNKMITGFEEYKGSLDFVERTAVLHDGGRVSIEKGRTYNVLEPDQTGGIIRRV